MGVKERKERERERRRQQIAVAAKRVFAEKGFNKARMEDIAGEAELAPATLYIYFRNKEELFASFSLTLLQCLSAKLKNIVNDPDADTDAKLAGLKMTVYELYFFDPWGLGSLLQVQSGEMLSNLSPVFISQFSDLFQYSDSLLRSLFEEGIHRGELVGKAPAAMVNIFWATLSGALLLDKNKGVFHAEADSFKETFDFAFDIFRRGLKRTYLEKDVQDKVCCQCALKPDCSGLRELFRVPETRCPELVPLSSGRRAGGSLRPPLLHQQAGYYS